jgi:ABC-2 type transport system ATP-binding protein
VTWGADDVVVRFGHHIALDGVSLDAPAGEVTAVVGGDGAGKTTLLRCLAGVVPVDRGVIRRPGATRIGYLAATSGTYPDLTVEENLDFAASAYGVAPREARQRAAGYLERTGLATVRDRLAGHLSGGMRQKLGVIRALLHHPDLVVLDEPTTGIDPVSRVDLWWLIARAAVGGAAVVMTTTYLDEAERAPTLLALEGGRPLACGGAADIVASVPGSLWACPAPPAAGAAALPAGELAAGELATRSWRRGGGWRLWDPDPDPPAPPAGQRIVPDLQDAVTVFSLARGRT